MSNQPENGLKHRIPPTTQSPTSQQDNIKPSTSPTPLTIPYHALEAWQQDNPLIHTGYRPASHSFLSSLHSLTYLHNESVNIYTHLFGALLSLALAHNFYDTLELRYTLATRTDKVVFGCFFAGAVACLGCSAGYHCFANVSRGVARWGNQVDYVGIVGLIWGSFVPSLVLGFGHGGGLGGTRSGHPHLVRGYLGMITTLAVVCATITLLPKFRTPTWRPFRTAMFVAMGLSAVIPMLHGMSIYGVEQLNHQVGLYWMLLQGGLYVLGAGLYAARIPERLNPGGYDIWGSSHQIFHVLVLLAAAAHFQGLLKAFDYEHGLRLSAKRM